MNKDILKFIRIISVILTCVASVLLIAIRYDELSSSLGEKYSVQAETSFSDIIFNNSDQLPNFRSSTTLTIEIWSPHSIKGTVSFKEVEYDLQIQDHISKSVSLPTDKYVIEFTNYSFSIDEAHTINQYLIPVNISKLWIDPIHLSNGARFNIGKIKLIINIQDIVTEEHISQEHIVPVIWDNEHE